MTDLRSNSWRATQAPGVSAPIPSREYPEIQSKICPACKSLHTIQEWSDCLEVCSDCRHHLKISLSQRLALLTDTIYHEIGQDIQAKDYLSFEDSIPYYQRLENAYRKSNRQEALEAYYCQIHDHKVVLALFDFDFIGGSMSSAVGERFVQAVHYSIAHRAPLICQATSGGARMQEGMYSLVQMTRTAAALAQLSEHKIPYIVTLCSPCMGGVSASLASLGDITLAEPNALIGFAGPRVIQQTVGAKLPKGFQTSEFVAQCGFIDQIVQRAELKATIARWIQRLQFGVEG